MQVDIIELVGVSAAGLAIFAFVAAIFRYAVRQNRVALDMQLQLAHHSDFVGVGLELIDQFPEESVDDLSATEMLWHLTHSSGLKPCFFVSGTDRSIYLFRIFRSRGVTNSPYLNSVFLLIYLPQQTSHALGAFRLRSILNFRSDREYDDNSPSPDPPWRKMRGDMKQTDPHPLVQFLYSLDFPIHAWELIGDRLLVASEDMRRPDDWLCMVPVIQGVERILDSME